jgi:hypothetical protein
MTTERAEHPYARRPGPSCAPVGHRGRPTLVPVRATALADLQDELVAQRAEAIDFALRMRTGATRITAAASAGSRMAVVSEAGRLGYLADRRLRQLGGDTA